MMVAAAVFASANATAAQLGQLSASVPQAPIVSYNRVRRIALHVPVRSKSSRIGCRPSMPTERA
jgi:hypothetical protein